MAHNKANEFDSTRVTFAACLLSLLSLFPLQCFLRQCKTTFLTFLVREGARLRERRLNWRLRSCTGVVVTCSKSRRKLFFSNLIHFFHSVFLSHAFTQSSRACWHGFETFFWRLKKKKQKQTSDSENYDGAIELTWFFVQSLFSVKQLQQIVRPPRVCIINERFV